MNTIKNKQLVNKLPAASGSIKVCANAMPLLPEPANAVFCGLPGFVRLFFVAFGLIDIFYMSRKYPYSGDANLCLNRSAIGITFFNLKLKSDS